MALRIFPAVTKFDFMRFRAVALGASGTGVLASILLFLFLGLNYGIDFRGGTLIQLKTPQAADIGQLRGKLSGTGLGEVELQQFGAPNEVLIRIERRETAGPAKTDRPEAETIASEVLRTLALPGATIERSEFVGPKVGEELIRAGVLATALAMAAIMIYVWFRFEWQFGLAGVIALVHDVLLTVGVFSLLKLEFNLTTVAALLTIAGYSINDTVVVFDRVRENLRKYKAMPFTRLLNLSVNETLSRTILTSSTTLLAVLMLFLFGGEVIHGFSFAMLFGIFVGTYSSIWVASALLVYMGVRRGTVAEGEEEAAAPANPPG
jgi:preprotein translocase SecF subunit